MDPKTAIQATHLVTAHNEYMQDAIEVLNEYHRYVKNTIIFDEAPPAEDISDELADLYEKVDGRMQALLRTLDERRQEIDEMYK